ncbi:MAG: hypothetical protein KBT04_03070, partial [Bacteroidales bacterium]|nr:hypothetical protein [Candidatus Colimorpha onthohippi]
FRTDTLYENVVNRVAREGTCDSVYTLRLFIYSDTVQDTAAYVACKTFEWRDAAFFVSQELADASSTTNDKYVLHVSDTVFIDSVRNIPNQQVIADLNANHRPAGAHNEFRVASRCDSLYTLHLRLNNDSIVEAAETVCDSLVWWEHNVKTTGAYHHTSVGVVYSGNGTLVSACDSLYTMNVTVYSDSTFSVDQQSACREYTWQPTNSIPAKTYTLADRSKFVNGGYDTLTVVNAVHGVCDSFYRIHLSIFDHDTLRDTLAACDSILWKYQQRSITKNTADNHYEYRISGIVGRIDETDDYQCDSVYELYLTVYHLQKAAVDNREVCDSLLWRNYSFFHKGSFAEEYSANSAKTLIAGQDTTVYDTVRNAVGSVCDSVYTINVKLHDSRWHFDTATVCHDTIWHLQYLTSQGNYSSYVNNAFTVSGSDVRCDSVYRLHLELYNLQQEEVPVYSVCDSLITHQHLRFTADAEDVYDTIPLAVHGVCDSVYHYHLLKVYSDSTAEPF